MSKKAQYMTAQRRRRLEELKDMYRMDESALADSYFVTHYGVKKIAKQLLKGGWK